MVAIPIFLLLSNTAIPLIGKEASNLKGVFNLTLGIYTMSSLPGALTLQAFYMTQHRETGDWLAVILSCLYYAALTTFALRSRRRWVFWLLYVVLWGCLLFSTGAFIVLLFFYKQ